MKSSHAQGTYDWRALLVGALLLALAGAILWDANNQTIQTTYGIGPTAMPFVVAGFLGMLAIGHFFVAFRKGLPESPLADGVAMGWISLGLFALLGLMLVGGGFVLAATLLFAFTARGFGRRALLVDLAIGFVIAMTIFLVFNKLLSLTLPTGPLERLL